MVSLMWKWRRKQNPMKKTRKYLEFWYTRERGMQCSMQMQSRPLLSTVFDSHISTHCGYLKDRAKDVRSLPGETWSKMPSISFTLRLYEWKKWRLGSPQSSQYLLGVLHCVVNHFAVTSIVICIYHPSASLTYNSKRGTENINVAAVTTTS